MQTPKPMDIPIHDIRPLLEVNDNSLYILILFVIIAMAMLIGVIFLVRYFIRKKEQNQRIVQFKQLESIDFSNPKEAAYTISEYGRFFRDDSSRHVEVYDNLVTRLAQYKYRKKVEESMDDETKGYYDIFIGMIDV